MHNIFLRDVLLVCTRTKRQSNEWVGLNLWIQSYKPRPADVDWTDLSQLPEPTQ